jgi:glycosyltransferase involved in cell wall biosynthesis
MKILLLHDYGTETGGAELQILSLRRGLLNKGHDVRLLSSSAIPVQGFEQQADYTCFGATSRVRVLAQTANISAYFKLKAILQDFQPDVVHLRIFLTQLSPLVLPLLRNVPCVYQTVVYNAICPLGTNLLPDGQTCHFKPGLPCLKSGCMTLQTWSALMVQRQLWHRWRSAIDQIIAQSYQMKSALEHAGLTPIDVIYNGVAERPQRPPLPTQPTIAYAGRLVSTKGVDTLLKAFALVIDQVPEARLLIAGQGDAELSLRQLSSELGLTNQVTWLGHRPRHELEISLDSAWVQVVPSVWAEPFANVILEAMMRGTAVVATAVGGGPEAIEPGRTGFLAPPGDSQTLANSLIVLLQSKELAETLGAAGRQKALACFSEERRNDAFESLYQRLQAKHSPNAIPAAVETCL